jgi:hypothetical protein
VNTTLPPEQLVLARGRTALTEGVAAWLPDPHAVSSSADAIPVVAVLRPLFMTDRIQTLSGGLWPHAFAINLRELDRLNEKSAFQLG